MREISKIIVLAKSIDGGTGTFVESLLKLAKLPEKGTLIKTLVLEKPQHRLLSKAANNFHFFKTQGKYPQNYTLSLSNIVGFLKEISWINKQIGEFEPDVLLGVGVHANLLLMVHKKILRRNTPAVLTTHIELNKTLTKKSSPLLKNILTKIITFFYNQADINVCVSRKASTSLKTNFKLKKSPKVIYNGIKTPTKVKSIPLNTKAPVFITVTRLTTQKAIETLIDAFKIFSEKVPSGRLLIVGDGPEKTKLIKYAKNLHLEKKIQFTGWVSNVNHYLARANIFTLSSTREGLPYALLEAMSQGKPIISTNAPTGPSEILDNGKYGLLIPVGNIQKFGKAMIRLGTNKKLYQKMSRLSQQRSSDFSENKMLEGYEKVFLNL